MTLTLYDVPPDLSGTIAIGGPPVSLTLGPVPGQNATLTFNGTAAQRVSLRLSNVTIGNTSCCGAKISMLKPDGTTVVPPILVGTFGATITATLPVTGAYSIGIDPQGAYTGGITLTLSRSKDGSAATGPAPGSAHSLGPSRCRALRPMAFESAAATESGRSNRSGDSDRARRIDGPTPERSRHALCLTRRHPRPGAARVVGRSGAWQRRLARVPPRMQLLPGAGPTGPAAGTRPTPRSTFPSRSRRRWPSWPRWPTARAASRSRSRPTVRARTSSRLASKRAIAGGCSRATACLSSSRAAGTSQEKGAGIAGPFRLQVQVVPRSRAARSSGYSR